MKKGKLVVLCGPSGTGKKTIWSGIIDKPIYNSVFSVSMTTRKKRPGEVEGFDYFYVTKKAFNDAIKNNKLLEHATYVNHFYGTPKDYVVNNLKKGKNVFLEIEMQGVLQVLKNWKDKKSLVTIFIAPPSLDELRKRLLGRKTESDSVIASRLAQSKWEMTQQNKFQYIIVNNKVPQAKRQLTKILNKELLNK